ncbi:MAG: hypothetical protein ACYC5O_22140 [Anaerolineae bacterium]
MPDDKHAWAPDTAALLREWDGSAGDGPSSRLKAAIGYQQASQYIGALRLQTRSANRELRRARRSLCEACADLAAAEEALAALRSSSESPAADGPALAALRQARHEVDVAQEARNQTAHEAWLLEQYVGLLHTQLQVLSGEAVGPDPLLALVLEVVH